MERNIVEYNEKEFQRCHYCRNTRAYFYDTINDEYLCRPNLKNCYGWRGQQEAHKHKCFYCKKRQAVAYFPTADRYCCHINYRKCPSFGQKMRAQVMERYKNNPTNTLKREIRDGKHECIYCGMTAHYLAARGPCCAKKAKQCPGYSIWIRKRMKQKYIDNPELIEKMRVVSREVHNRPEVIDAKSEKMLHLHNDDCTECKDFKNKFLRAHARRRKV